MNNRHGVRKTFTANRFFIGADDDDNDDVTSSGSVTHQVRSMMFPELET